MIYYVYILQSVKAGRYYIGVTNNVRRRLQEHNGGLSKSSAPYAPYTLVRVERYARAQEAYQRELFLKGKKSKRIIEKIIQSSPDVLAEQEVGIPTLQSRGSASKRRDSVGRANDS